MAKRATVYLKATAMGLVSAVLFAAVWMWAALWIPIWWQMWLTRNEGGGVGASSVGSGSVLLAAIIGFALGFFWLARNRVLN
jgi:hypothetical protein